MWKYVKTLLKATNTTNFASKYNRSPLKCAVNTKKFYCKSAFSPKYKKIQNYLNVLKYKVVINKSMNNLKDPLNYYSKFPTLT